MAETNGHNDGHPTGTGAPGSGGQGNGGNGQAKLATVLAGAKAA